MYNDCKKYKSKKKLSKINQQEKFKIKYVSEFWNVFGCKISSVKYRATNV